MNTDTHLKLKKLLKEKPMTNTELAEALNLNIKSISYHIRLLGDKVNKTKKMIVNDKMKVQVKDLFNLKE